jgi:hypothetical protein
MLISGISDLILFQNLIPSPLIQRPFLAEVLKAGIA